MSEVRAGAFEVVRRLRDAGYSAYLAGGCVRDLILGQVPKDWDIATSAEPGDIIRLFRRTLQIGVAFGVVKVLLKSGQEYEVATYRKDNPITDGRRPIDVTFSSSAKEDVERRDFTINALLLDPFPGPTQPEGAVCKKLPEGLVLDFVNGLADIEAKTIRAVGNPAARFCEDHLRMLRAVRFATRLNFRIEGTTWRAIHDCASLIRQVSAERVLSELNGIWSSGRAISGYALLVQTGLLAEFEGKFFGTGNMRGLTSANLTALDAHPIVAERPLLAWAMLCFNDGGVADVLQRIPFSNEQRRLIYNLVTIRYLTHPAWVDSPSVLRLISSNDALARSFFFATCEDLQSVRHWLKTEEELKRNPLPTRESLLSSKELLELGVAPGPRFGAILRKVEDEIYTGAVRTKEQAFSLARFIAQNVSST